MFQKFTRLLLASCCLAATAFAQDGAIDGTFGINGKVWDPPSTYPISTITPGTPARILVQPDGRILHIAPTGSVGVHITRYLPNGAIDGSFGTGGSVTTNEVAGVYQPRNAYMLPDGRFYVIGESRVNEFGAEHGFAVLRYLANGSLDNSFSGDGKTVIPLATSVPMAHGIAVQSDGKIVVAGNAGQWTTTRFHPDGSIDNSFDGDGIVRTDFNFGNDAAFAVTIAPDGKIVVAGLVTNQRIVNGQAAFSQDAGIVRYNSDGSLDGSFGNGGKVTHITPGTIDAARGVAISPSTGNIHIGGDWSLTSDIDNSGFFAARFLPNGTLDGSYNGGYVAFNITARARAVDLRMQTDEKILIGGFNTCGQFCPNEGWVDIHLARLTTSGQLDGSFDGDGKAKIEYQFLAPPGVGSVDMGGSIDAQGSKLITGGLSRYTGQTKKLLVRLNNSAALLPRDLPAQQPYVPIPATIEAETYTGQSGTQLEPTADAGGGQNVGYMDQGDYLEYRISVPSAGDYTLSLRVASFVGNASVEVRTETGQVLTVFSVPNTGSWQNWTTLSAPVTLPTGNHTIRLTSLNGAGWNINWLQFDQGVVQPPPPAYVAIPAKIEAEAYVNQSGIQLENTTDAGGGQNVGWIDQADYLEYDITSASGGTFSFAARVASAQSGGMLELRIVGGGPLGSIAIPNTGDWQAWTTVSTTVNVPAGNHRIVIVSTSPANWNINWFEFSQDGTPPPPGYVLIPAKIEAENFANQSGTQNEGTTDAGGGQNVGYIDAGDWLDYNITVPSAGAYTLSLRLASLMPGAQVGIYSQGGLLLGTVNVPNTGGWQNWTTESAVINLPAGNMVIRLLSMNASNWNINWLQFEHATVTPPGYVPVPAKIEAEAYAAQSGTQLEATGDAGGGQNVGYVDQGDWLEYNINVPAAGSYFLDLRVASFFDGGIIEVRNSANTLLAAFHVPNTGGWQNWTTLTRSLVLPQGTQTLRLISAHSSGWNLNWLQIYQPAGRRPELTMAGNTQLQLSFYPNPVQQEAVIDLEGTPQGRVTLEVIGINGAVMYTAVMKKEAGRSRLQLPLGHLGRGQYFLRASMDGWTTTKKFIKLQ